MELNSYQTALAEQLGTDYAHVPSRYLHSSLPDYLKEITVPDNLSGLPVMIDSARLAMFTQITKAVREQQPFAVFKADSDQLKAANDQINHQFGDESIRYSSGLITQKLEAASLSCPHFAFRAAQAGDEIIVFFFSPNDEDRAKIKQLTQEINSASRPVSVPTPSGSVSFLLSTSAGVVLSLETAFSRAVEDTRLKLVSVAIPHAYNLAHQAVEKASDRAGAVKVLHELSRIPVENLLRLSPLEFKKHIAGTFGGLRISTAGLNIILIIDQVLTANFFQSRAEISPVIDIEQDILSQSDPKSAPLLRRLVTAHHSLFKP